MRRILGVVPYAQRVKKCGETPLTSEGVEVDEHLGLKGLIWERFPVFKETITVANFNEELEA